MTEKQCTKCKEVKSVSKFAFIHGKKTFLRFNQCNICRNNYLKSEVIKIHGKEEWEKFCFEKFKGNVRSLIIGSFKRGKKKYKKKLRSEEILGCSIEFFQKYIESKFTKGMTLENYGEWHLDHIIPLATAKNEEDVIRLNHYRNFQPLWAFDNFSKGGRINEPIQISLRV